MFWTFTIMITLAVTGISAPDLAFANAYKRDKVINHAPVTVPLELWQSGTVLTLSSGHSVMVTPPRIYSLFTVFETDDDGNVVIDEKGNIKEQSAKFQFISFVAFDFSTVSAGELRLMAKEIMDRHLNSRIEEMDKEAEGRSVSGIIRFAVDESQRPDPQSILIERYADIRFARDAGDNWRIADN